MKTESLVRETLLVLRDFVLEGGFFLLGMLAMVTSFAAEIDQPAATFNNGGMTVGSFGEFKQPSFVIFCVWTLIVALVRLWPAIQRMFGFIDNLFDQREVEHE